MQASGDRQGTEPPAFVTYDWTLYSDRASFTLSTLAFSPDPLNSLIKVGSLQVRISQM